MKKVSCDYDLQFMIKYFTQLYKKSHAVVML